MPYWWRVKPPMYWLVDPRGGEGMLAQFNMGRYVVEVFPINSVGKSAISFALSGQIWPMH